MKIQIHSILLQKLNSLFFFFFFLVYCEPTNIIFGSLIHNKLIY